MSRKRKYISFEKRLAAALLQTLHDDGTGNLVPVISYEESKALTPKQVISRFDLHHYPVRHAEGGKDHPSNLTWMAKPAHKKRTREIDIPEIAKGKRIVRKADDSRRRLLARKRGAPKPKSKWPKRSFQRGRGFQRRAGAESQTGTRQ